MNEKDFLQFIAIKKGLSTGSIKLCRTRFYFIMRWLKANNKELNKSSVEELIFDLKQKGRSNNTLNTYLFVFKLIQDYLIDRGVDNRFYKGFCTFDKVKTQIVILTPDEIEKLIDTKLTYANRSGQATDELNLTYTTFIMFLAHTGCRFSEATKLQVKRLDLESGKATFIETKNKEIRHAYFTKPLIDRLTRIVQSKKPDDLVFTNSIGKNFKPQTYSYDLEKRCKLAGITKRVHPHLFRHSFATQLLMAGVDVTMVASILGHKDIQTTFSSYVHLADVTLKKATYKHPLLRRNIDPGEIIKNIKDSIESYNLDTDIRFEYKVVEEGPNSFSFKVLVK